MNLLTRAVAILLFAAFAVTVTPASAQSIGGDVVACGGYGEYACPTGSQFDFENGGTCDRGLRLNLINGVCENNTRQTGRGTAFRYSWLGRALRSQLDDVRGDTSITDLPTMIGVHNAFNNFADSYLAGSINQEYSITDLLDAGFRYVDLDVHASRNHQGLTGLYPKMCHGVGIHPPQNVLPYTGCTVTDRWFSNGLKEIRDWMRGVANTQEVLVIGIQNEIEAGYPIEIVDQAIRTYLVNPYGIGVFTKADLAANGGHWPSRSWMVNHGKRVILLMSSDDKTAPASVYAHNGFDGRSTMAVDEFTDQATCKSSSGGQVRGLTIYADELPDGTRPVTADDLKNAQLCDVRFFSIDQLIDPQFDPARLSAMVWTWADQQPPAHATGKAALLNTTTGRWEARDTAESHFFLCSTSSGWRQTDNAGPWHQGFAECQRRFGRVFDRPIGPRANAQVITDLKQQVPEVWINFVPLGNGNIDRWSKAEPLAVDFIVRPEVATSAPTATEFSLQVPATTWPTDANVEWNFGDGQLGSGTFTSHVYAVPGDYTVSVRVTDQFGATATREKTMHVYSPDDPFAKSRLVAEWPASATAGTDLVIPVRYKADWLLGSISCGLNGQHVATVNVAAPDGMKAHEVHCRYTWSGGPYQWTAQVSIPVYQPVGVTSSIYSEVTQAIPVRHFVQPVIAVTGPNRVSVGSSVQYTIDANDPDGGQVQTPQVSCGAGFARSITKISSDGGYSAYTFVCDFSEPVQANTVTVTVDDDDFQRTVRTLEVTVGQAPDGTVNVLSAPSPVEGGAAIFRAVVTATENDNVVIKSVTCDGRAPQSQTSDLDTTNAAAIEFTCQLVDGPSELLVAVTVSDVDGERVLHASLAVANAAPVITGVVSPAGAIKSTQAMYLPIVVSDAGLDAVTTVVNWGDGTSTTLMGTGSLEAFHQWVAGTFTVVVSATDEDGATAQTQFTVSVVDPAPAQPPTVQAPKTIKAEATSASGAVVTFAATATDPVDGSLPVSCLPASGSQFPLGVTLVTCSATNAAGLTAADTIRVNVRDTTAPAIASVTPSVASLPSTNQVVPVTLAVSVADVVDAAPVCRIKRVTGGGKDLDRDGDIDWTITGDLSLDITAVALRKKDRTYTITVACTDASANVSKEKTAIIVAARSAGF